jgi:hypothetical protein
VFFVGERLNAGTQIVSLNADSLDDFIGETFINRTNDVVEANSDVAYSNLEQLNIKMGHSDVVVNVRGTSANTTITTQEGNDKVFIGSDANEDGDSAGIAEVLYGVLDYIEKDLYIDVGGGRHRLLISDSFSNAAKGVGSDGSVLLTESSLTNLADDLGDIYFAVNEGGSWLDGITLWLGKGDDQIDVTSIHTVGSPTQTTTTVHSGKGDDIVTVDISASVNGGCMFIADGQVSVL